MPVSSASGADGAAVSVRLSVGGAGRRRIRRGSQAASQQDQRRMGRQRREPAEDSREQQEQKQREPKTEPGAYRITPSGAQGGGGQSGRVLQPGHQHPHGRRDGRRGLRCTEKGGGRKSGGSGGSVPQGQTQIARAAGHGGRTAAEACIAAAAAIKIYPAVFGLIYICEKRYKEAVRLIIYGILFFFVPFAFTGGINGFLQFLSNQKNVHETWGRLSKISIYSLSKLFGVPNNAALIISAVFALVAIIMFFLAKKNWQKYFALIFIMVMCPMWSGQYTICLFFLPFIEFIREENNNINILNILYAVMFSLFLSSSIFDRSTTEIKNFLGILMLFILILFQIINDKKRSRCI